jgi:hypothetical protein
MLTVRDATREARAAATAALMAVSSCYANGKSYGVDATGRRLSQDAARLIRTEVWAVPSTDPALLEPMCAALASLPGASSSGTVVGDLKRNRRPHAWVVRDVFGDSSSAPQTKRHPKLRTGLGPGQWIEKPTPRRKPTLEDRAWKAILHGVRAAAVAEELRASGGAIAAGQVPPMVETLDERIGDLLKLKAALLDFAGVTASGLAVTGCAVCGKPVTGVRSDARYCSNACRQRAYRQRI